MENKDNQIPSTRTPPTVLVVEDDRSVRRVLEFSLEGAGFDMVAASGTGAEALECLDRQDPEAIVLDLGLADGLGRAVLERLLILQSCGNHHSIWVLISALDEDEADNQYGSLGSRFLRKPLDPTDLVRTLEELLASKEGS